MDTLRALSEVTVPDPRSEGFAVLEPEVDGYRPKTIEDHYASISRVTLHAAVPEEVRQHFETTRNLLLYSWFVYRFIPVAEFHAACTLEYALKIKTDGGIKGLYRLIEHAIEMGWVSERGFSGWHHRERTRATLEDLSEMMSGVGEQRVRFHDEPYDFLKKLQESIPEMRNEYAHGSSMAHSGGYAKLEVCAEFVNQLFDEAEGPPRGSEVT